MLPREQGWGLVLLKRRRSSDSSLQKQSSRMKNNERCTELTGKTARAQSG